MDQTPVELESILSEIEKALEAKLYYIAIAVSLSVPDICACLELDQSDPKSQHGVSKRYTNWCDANLSFDALSGLDLFYIRCGIAHSGHVYKNNSRYQRVMFMVPGGLPGIPQEIVFNMAEGVSFDGVDAEDLRLGGKMLIYDLSHFCGIIMAAARNWAASKKMDAIVQKNLPMLIRHRPDGLPPFLSNPMVA